VKKVRLQLQIHAYDSMEKVYKAKEEGWLGDYKSLSSEPSTAIKAFG
jgi:hypothetical protein